VIQAQNGQEALTIAQEVLPDLIISDVMMPVMDGISLCQELKNDPHLDYLPIILLTAKATVADKLDGLKIGADDYIEKPFDMSELKARIKNIITSRKRLKAIYTRPIQLEATQVQVDSADYKFLKKLQNIVEQQLSDPDFSVERLAREVGKSRGNLHKRLRSTIDKTPTEVIKDLRLQRSADLISQSAGSISEIAYSVGFKSVSHFSTSFSKKYGVSPKSFN
jgi:DNA-binding response OmpR family regulator